MRGAITSALLVGVLLGSGCKKQYFGDGLVVDNGFWSYPRYAIAFDSLDATNGASRTYNFTGTPSAQMTFGFVLVGANGGEAANVANITKENGTSIASVEAALKDWQASRSSQRVMFWHESYAT